MQLCSNGHFYDDSKNDFCPYCGFKSSPENDKDYIGSVFDECVVTRKLAQDSISEVYEVSGKRALKVFKCGNDPLKVRSATKEFRIMKKANDCPYILSALDMKAVNDNDNIVVYILEELATPGLKYFKNRDITVCDVNRIMSGLCAALEYLNKKEVRMLGIKPDNIYVSQSGTIKLGDFSRAQYATEISELKVESADVFVAPEVYERQDYNNTMQIYSLGMVLYYLLTGKMLFSFNDREIKVRRENDEYPESGIDKALLDIIKKATAYQPENRYVDFKEFLQDIMNVPPDTKITEFNKSKVEIEDVFTDSLPLTIPVLGVFENENKTHLPGAFSNINVKSMSSYEKGEETHNLKGEGKREPLENLPQYAPAVPTACMPVQPLPSKGSGIPCQGGEGVTPDKKQKAGSVIGKLGKLFSFGNKKNKEDSVQFRAAAPAIFEKNAYSQVKIMMYREDDYARADREMKSIAKQVSHSSSGVFSFAKNDNVRIVLQSPDVQIEDDIREFVWGGMFSECTFDVYVPGDYNKKQIRFKGRVYRGQAVLTDLSLIVSVEADKEQDVSVKKCDLPTAFVSYASQDRNEVVARIQGIQAARRDMDIFLDVEKLRCGEYWQKRLYKEIEKRSIFYLFWSMNASKSEWVKKELRHAISSNGIDCVEPIPLDSPEVCPPPEELKERHFNDWTLRYLGK